MPDKNKVARYFDEKAAAWLQHAYTSNGYNYPTAPHRNRITLQAIRDHFGGIPQRLLDIGCGDGTLCLEAARDGHRATGIDQSGAMLEQAAKRMELEAPELRSQVEFRKLAFDQIYQHIPAASASAVSALGFIGYLPNDEMFFQQATRILEPGGLLLVSCRNRLMNMTSVGPYTRREIDNGSAPELIDELESLYQDIPSEQTQDFIQRLQGAATELGALTVDSARVSASDPAASGFTVEARQHTPKQLSSLALGYDFTLQGLFGVHPHLFTPKLNRLLPPRVFNQLSQSLLAFESHPVSLVWSSIFIAVFTKPPDTV